MSLFWVSLLMNVAFEPLPKQRISSPFLLLSSSLSFHDDYFYFFNVGSNDIIIIC